MQLDTAASLRRRLDGMLFGNVIFRGTKEFEEFASLIDAKSWTELDKMTARRVQRKSQRHRQGVLPVGFQSERGNSDGPSMDNYPRSDLWLFQRHLRSRLGHILPEDSDEPIELAKDLGMLSSGYALTEFGNLTKTFVLRRFGDSLPAGAQPNPLDVYSPIEERILYLYALLNVDAIFPAMVELIVSRAPINASLSGALDHLLKTSEDTIRLDEVNELKDLASLRQRIEKEPVNKAQRVPRLEFMVDLGLLERSAENGKAESQYLPTEATPRFSDAFRELNGSPGKASIWLDHNFFGAAGSVYEIPTRHSPDELTTLLYFARGAALLGKRTGFIPGRAASIAAAVLALTEGHRLEIADVFQCAYGLPKTAWAPYVKFSGGSRLDSEFLVAIDPELERVVRERMDSP
jgi:hypothetical protein